MEYNELTELIEKISALLSEKNFRAIKSILDEEMPQDVAALLEDLPDKDMPVIFRLLSKEQAADTFVEMNTDSQEMLINVFSDSELKAIFDEMFVDDTVDIIEEMPASVVKRIISRTPKRVTR